MFIMKKLFYPSMLSLLILKICKCAFARNFDKFKLENLTLKDENRSDNEEDSSEYESEEDDVNTKNKLYWVFKKKKDVYMIFSELVDDCFTKESAPNNFFFKSKSNDLDFKYEIEYNKISRRKRPEDRIDDPVNYDQTFAYINEEVRFGIAEDAVDKIVKKNLIIRINLVKNENFNYYRVPIILSDALKEYHPNEGVLELYCGDFGYFDLFNALYCEKFFNLPDEDYKKCIAGLKELYSMTEKDFKSKFGDKKFLIVHLNIVTIRPLLMFIMEQDRKNVQMGDFFRTIFAKIIQPFFPKIKLPEHFTRHDKRRDMDFWLSSWSDVFAVRISYGMLTDILNLLGYYVDNNTKFSFYEAYEFLRSHVGTKEPFIEKFKSKK